MNKAQRAVYILCLAVVSIYKEIALIILEMKIRTNPKYKILSKLKITVQEASTGSRSYPRQ